MRILSWNVNGIRTLPQFHPWNTLKTGDAILDELKADIVCFQEMKIQRATIEKHIAAPKTYDSFFSFPVNKGGYSGVAVYTKKAFVAPLKAEEGLTGNLQPKPPLSEAERISQEYPKAENLGLYPDESENVPKDLQLLDVEGRALVVDFGLFVLINVYCPAETSELRLPYKMNFILMLQERVRILIQEGREVIVLGDINVASTPLDHCDGHLASVKDNFYEHPPRTWFKNFQTPSGPMVDVVRTAWPDRKGMYTCWNTKTFARASNYGSRVDYVLFTTGLIPWLKHGDIDASIKGSDHCPIYVDLHDEITLPSGDTIKIQDAMKFEDGRKHPPRISASLWDEFKQTSLASFFVSAKRGNSNCLAASSSSTTTTSTSVTEPDEGPGAATKSLASVPTPTPTSMPETADNPASGIFLSPKETPETPPVEKQLPPPPPPSSQTRTFHQAKNSQGKRKLDESTSKPSRSGKRHKVGQQKISTFFSKPTPASSSSQRKCDRSLSEHDFIDIDGGGESINSAPTIDELMQIEEDHKLARSLSEETLLSSHSSIKPQDASESKVAWGQLFAPIQTPECTVHNEPCKQYTVNKAGPNKGKMFFLCSRPVGPGYDKGRSERLREEVDHQYRCNFFKWASEVKKETPSKPGKKSS